MDAKGDDGERGPYSWVNFDNTKRPGEVLSFVLWKVPGDVHVTDEPVRQASIEAFTSNGSARRSTPETGIPIADTLRHRVVIIDLKAKAVKHEVEALEFSYVYGDGDPTLASMAHGYCVVFDGEVLFVQHTSDRPITSEIAFQMAGGLVAKHFHVDGKAHSFGRGKIKQIYD